MDFGLIIIGLVVGFLVGLTGVGGAALLTPILIFIGFNPSIAVGTDLVYNSITKLFGAWQHLRQKTVQLKIAFLFAAGSIPGAVLAVFSLHWFDFYFGGADIIIKKALGIVLIIIPFAMILGWYLKKDKESLNRWQVKDIKEKRFVIIFIGFVLGSVVGLTSIGSGSLFALALMYFFHIQGKDVVGTDIFHALLLVTAAGLVNVQFGNVNFPVVFQLLCGSIPGVLIGSRLSTKVPTFYLRVIISILIMLSGIKLIDSL